MLVLATTAVPVAWWVGAAAALAVAGHGVAVALFVPRPRPALGGLEALAAAATLALLGGAPLVALVVLALGALITLGVASAAPGAEPRPNRDHRRVLAVILGVGLGALLVVASVVGIALGAGVAAREGLPVGVSPEAIAALLTHGGRGWLAAVGLAMLLVAVVVAATGRGVAPVDPDHLDETDDEVIQP